MMKKVFFITLKSFLLFFDHANTCASMHLLVEIHNRLESRRHISKGLSLRPWWEGAGAVCLKSLIFTPTYLVLFGYDPETIRV